MNNRGIKIARVNGITVFIDFSWILIFILASWILSVSYFPNRFGLNWQISWSLGIMMSIFFFLSALLHELAHAFVANKSKVPTRQITMYLFGGLNDLFEEPRDPDTEFKIAVAGPAISLFLAIVFMAGWTILGNLNLSPIVISFFSILFQVNLILAMFNLLPGFPLDGGRIVRSIIWASTNDIMTATKIASSGGQAVALFIIFFGFFQILFSGVWGGIWLVLIGLFLNQAAVQNLLELKIKSTLREKLVSDFMQNSLFINPKLSIKDALTEYFAKSHSTVYPVLEDNEIKGVLTLEDIRLSENLTEDNRVFELMRSFPRFVSITPNDSALKALKLMTMRQLTFIPVKDKTKIIGVITLDRIAMYLADNNVI